MNRKLRPTAVLLLTRKVARQHGCVVDVLPGRGKGSHRLVVVLDAERQEAARFTLPGHARELSWTVLRTVENALAHVFGEQWMEER